MLAVELASEHGAETSTLARILRVDPRQVRDLLGVVDQRPILRLVSND